MTEASVRWAIEARGDVQRVGYRDFVEAIGRKLSLTGTVRNDVQDPRLVHIVAQGPSKQLSQFMRSISGVHGIIHAESVTQVQELPEDSSLVSFTQVRGADLKEIAESREAAVKLLGRMWDTGQETLSVSKETLRAVRDGNRELGSKVDRLGAKVDRLGSKVDHVGSRVHRHGGKVDKVTGAVRAEGWQNAGFRHELAQAVAHLDPKHGSISKTLGRIEHALEQQTTVTVKSSERQTAAILKLARQVALVSGRPSKRAATRRR